MDKQIENKSAKSTTPKKKRRNQIVIMQNDLTIPGGKADVEDIEI